MSSSRLFSGTTIRFLMPLFESAATSSSSASSLKCMAVLTAHANIPELPVDRILSLAMPILNLPRGGSDANILLHGISSSLTDQCHLDCLLGDDGLLSSNSFVRKVALEALMLSPLLQPPHATELVAIIYAVSKSDDADETLRELAVQAWHRFEFLYRPIAAVLLPFLSHPVLWVRHTMAIAIGNAMGEENEDIEAGIGQMLDMIAKNPDEMIQSQFDIDACELGTVTSYIAIWSDH